MTTRASERFVIEPVGRESGFHECWYPVITSAEVGEEAVMTTPFLGGDVVVWRGVDGVAHVQTPYCPHMGAHLGEGTVVGNTIQCYFHHWCFRGDGACAHIPVGAASIPDTARVFAYPAVEKYATIWAYNGTTPAYEVPDPPSITDDTVFTFSQAIPMTGAYYAQVSNAFDIQHFAFVHEMEGHATTPSELGPDIELTITDTTMGYVEPLLGTAEAHMTTHGPNVLTMVFFDGNGNRLKGGLFAATPMPDGTHLEYLIECYPRGDGSEASLAIARDAWEAEEVVREAIREEDYKALHAAHFRPRHFTDADVWLKAFLERVRDWPRTDPAADFQ
jgi:phenylpropionate dioxygenase-like ring-hydroxylating dioxygenase large terminal subunit